MNLLLVNDDGIQSPGLWALSGALVRSHAVTVAAPDGNRSAIGHGITLREPLYAARADFPHGVEAWAVSGTPADCTRLGLLNFAPGPVDLVVSGPNKGDNTALDLLYSGTVAAALEAAMMGVKAISLSAPIDADDQQTVETFLCIFDMLDLEQDFDQVLNINIPALPIQKIKGLRWARQGAGNRWQGPYEEHMGQDGRVKFTPPNRPAQRTPGSTDDWNSLNDGWITLTPLNYQLEQPLEGRRQIPWQ